MAVPNTTTFSLEDVRTEIGLGATTGLVECFASANAGGFDPAYEGSKNNLLNFRNYTDVCISGLTVFNFYPTPTTTGSACTPVGGESTTFVHNGGGADPVDGNLIYTDISGCVLFDGGGSWFAIRNGTSYWKITVSSVGVVGSKTAC
jgi:hypothetical protein